MTGRTDIAEVARHARVSKSTVSRVINGGYASAEVKARVAKVIAKLGYTPWTTARNFSLGRAGCFGLVMESSQSEWITQILGGIEEELTAKHISLLVGSLVLKGTYDATTVLSWIRERRVDGLIFAGPGRRERAVVETARKAKVSLSLITPNESFKSGAVLRSNNVEAGREIADHLYDLGHRRIAFLGGPKESLDSQQRFEGLESGLKAKKVKLLPSNVTFAPRYHVEEGKAYAERWLKIARSRAPTAVVLANDTMALGFIRTLHGQSVGIPSEVSVVGFDDIPAASLCWPGLTTVRQQMRAMGAAACRTLLTALLEEQPERSVLEFPMDLVVRQSTGPAPRAALP
ncbi:MAG TPA: LacI family DNA-binding transcriptional regulator [Polyangiaceae bacterium]|jgi:LacI family transcriptional regulator